ncbi:hypothetical protein GCM10027605_36700 [Micromonospora zhanjiangensis]
MDALDVARWQFGVTTVYHFLFVPLTIGLSMLVAVLQTRWYRTGDPRMLQLTRFYGKLFLINFAMGVVTGIVQEFQFGMNWSDYSRFVGDVFGAPWPSRPCSRSSSNPPSSACGSSAGTGCPNGCTWPPSGPPPSAPPCRRTSSSPRTPGCRTPSATGSTPTPAAPNSPTSSPS